MNHQAIRQSYAIARQSQNCRGKIVMRRVVRLAVKRGAVVVPKNKTRTVCIASETPVTRWDEQRRLVVREILLMDGFTMRDGMRQLPIVDSHDRSTVKNVFGSIRNLRIDRQRLVGEVFWARSKDAQSVAGKWNDGHLTDFSISAYPLELIEVSRGQVWRSITGPANVVTRWEATDASIVACGADVEAR